MKRRPTKPHPPRPKINSLFLPQWRIRLASALPPPLYHVLPYGALLVLFWLTGLALGASSLTYDWFYDDLHLVRNYSSAELQRSLVSNWDPDNIETPGYRPLTVLFNHVRSTCFGESVITHRVAQIGLLALLLTLAGGIAREFGMTYLQIAVAGLIALVARNNWYNLVWISDGVHAFAGILLFGAAWLFIRSVKTLSLWQLLAGLVLAALGLATREEALILFPLFVIAMLGALFWEHHASGSISRAALATYARQPQVAPRLRRIIIATVALALLGLGFLCLSSALAPGSQLALDWKTSIVHARATLDPRGLTGGETELLWYGTLGFLVGVTLFFTRGAARLRALVWLGAFLWTTVSVFTFPRPNLLLYPIIFFSFGLVCLLANVLRISRPAFAVCALLTLGMAVLSIQANMTAQLAQHPDSLDRITRNGHMLFEVTATIPPERRTRLLKDFAARGINSQETLWQRAGEWGDLATQQLLRSPNPNQLPFIPPIRFLVP